MNMKKKSNNCFGFLLLALVLFSACSNSPNLENHEQHQGVIYTCPMHPEIESKEAGNCPICNMKLVPKISENNTNNHQQHQQQEIIYTCPMHPEIESNEEGICPKCKMNLELKISSATHQLISPNKQVLSRQSTIKLNSNNKAEIIHAQGIIGLDKNKNISVSARYGGRIEQLAIKYDWQFVKKGDKILDLYSPELNTIQEEHLFLLKSNTTETLINQSREKLRLLGISPEQIKTLETSGKINATVSVFSPATGYVFFDLELQNSNNSSSSESSSTNAMGMQTMSNNNEKKFSSNNSQIRQGMYINKGQNLFVINDLQSIWATISIPSEFSTLVSKNKSVEISSEVLGNNTVMGNISLIEQEFEEKKQRFVKVRVPLKNTNNQLKINAPITAKILLDNRHFQIPSSAIYRTGLSAVVWVKKGVTEEGTGIFELRKVTIGSTINGMTTIIHGLSSDEEVAKQAGYLSDSETFLNGN